MKHEKRDAQKRPQPSVSESRSRPGRGPGAAPARRSQHTSPQGWGLTDTSKKTSCPHHTGPHSSPVAVPRLPAWHCGEKHRGRRSAAAQASSSRGVIRRCKRLEVSSPRSTGLPRPQHAVGPSGAGCLHRACCGAACGGGGWWRRPRAGHGHQHLGPEARELSRRRCQRSSGR